MEVPSQNFLQEKHKEDTQVAGQVHLLHHNAQDSSRGVTQAKQPVLEPYQDEIYCVKEIFDFLIARDVELSIDTAKVPPVLRLLRRGARRHHRVDERDPR